MILILISKSKDPLFETSKSSRKYVLKEVSFVNILLPVNVWSVPAPNIVNATVTSLQYANALCATS